MYLNKEPLHQNPKAKFVLIHDSKSSSGFKLFKTFLKSFIKEKTPTSLFLYDHFVDDVLFDLNFYSDNIEVLDAISDPCSWNSGGNQCLLEIGTTYEKLSNFKGVVFLCSLTPLIYKNGVNKVYKMLHKAIKENSDLQLVVLFHSDVHPPEESDIIQLLASTSLTTVSNGDNFISTVHFSNGKVSKQLMECKISSVYEFEILRDVDLQLTPMLMKQPDPTENLSFNLKLKDNEVEARRQLQLPYMQVDEDSIIQNLLENEYLDEEDDPDDDLDI